MGPKVIPTVIMMLIVLIFPQGSPSTQKSNECERQLAQCQATVKQLNDQVSRLDKSYNSLKLELDGAKREADRWLKAYQQAKENAGSNDCEQRLAAAQGETEKCRNAYNDLSKQIGDSKQIDDLKNRLAESSRALSDLRGQLATAQREAEMYRRENAQNLALISDLKNQVTELRRGPGELEKQLNATRQDVEKYRRDYNQLSAQNEDLKTRYSNINSEFSSLKSQMSKLTLSENSLQQQLGAANQELTQSRSENARLLAAKSNLDQHVAGLERQLKEAGMAVPKKPISNAPDPQTLLDVKPVAPTALTYSPQALLDWSRTLNEHAVGNQDRTGLSYEKDGKTHVVTELVIGTLESIYDRNVRPGARFPVEANFTPHPILNIPQTAANPITWQLELQYESSRIKDVRYNAEMSGRKAERREIKLDGATETWVWELRAPADFQKDRSEIIVFAGYSIPNQEPILTDITREPVELTAQETPGAFALALAFIKDNLTYILGVISVLVGIWAAFISIKKGKLEVKLKEMELEPKA